MALSEGDHVRLDKQFGAITGKLDSFHNEFTQHRLDDQATALALKAHVEACNASKVRRRRSWVFWAGIIVAVLAPIIATIVEHAIFTRHVTSLISK